LIYNVLVITNIWYILFYSASNMTKKLHSSAFRGGNKGNPIVLFFAVFGGYRISTKNGQKIIAKILQKRGAYL